MPRRAPSSPTRTGRCPARSRSARRSTARRPVARATSPSTSRATAPRCRHGRSQQEPMATTLTNTYQDIPAGSSCTVTETSNGATTTVTATVAGANQTITIAAGTVASLSITDTFTPAPGAVEIVKTIDGPDAGSQGLIGILLICRAPIQVFAMVIPAGHPAGPVSQIFNGVGGGSTCLAVEVVDGHTDNLAVEVTGASQQVTVPAAGIASVQMTDGFGGPASQPQPPAPHPRLPVTGLSAPVEPLIGYAIAAILA